MEAVKDKISMVVALPPIGVTSGLFLLMQGYLIATLHPSQKKAPAAYSKFAKEKKPKPAEDKPKEKSGLSISAPMRATLAYSIPFVAGGAFLCYQFYSRYYSAHTSP